jgi:hypothetical protein
LGNLPLTCFGVGSLNAGDGEFDTSVKGREAEDEGEAGGPSSGMMRVSSGTIIISDTFS